MPDRCVHARTVHGGEVVRYDRAGKWYLEADGWRQKITLADAARIASQPGAQVFSGRSGGGRFDAQVAALQGTQSQEG